MGGWQVPGFFYFTLLCAGMGILGASVSVLFAADHMGI